MSNGCDRYKTFVRTASGLTPADPTGFVATFMDYQEWLGVANEWVSILEENVTIHQGVAGASGWPEQAVLLRTRLDEAPAWWNPTLTNADLQDVVNIAVQAACRTGELEDELAQLGAEARIPYKGATPPPDPVDWGDVAEGAAIGGGAVLAAAVVWWILSR